MKLSDIILENVDLSSAVPEDTSYKDFAKAVAKLLREDYGEHNFEPFMEVLHAELGMNEVVNEAAEPVSLSWGELTVQKLRDLGFDRLKAGVKFPTDTGDMGIIWGAAIVAKPGSREEAAAMRSSEARLRRYKESIEKTFDVNADTKVSIDSNGVASVEGVEQLSPEELEKMRNAYYDSIAAAIKKDRESGAKYSLD